MIHFAPAMIPPETSPRYADLLNSVLEINRVGVTGIFKDFPICQTPVQQSAIFTRSVWTGLRT